MSVSVESGRLRPVRLLVTLALFLVVAATFGQQAPAGSFTLRGTVTGVADGDTVTVRLASGKRERVRLIGIDSPERGACFASPAAARARHLALAKPVVLRGDATQATRDRYGRLLAYVWIPGGRDLGYQLLAGGFGKSYVYERPFSRLSAYLRAEAVGKRLARSVWSCGATTPQPVVPRAATCDPNYTGYCVPPYDQGDVDCADIPVTVRVVGSDPHRLDGDGDGYGCE
jgi:endonuclease YncB( thermonuclease family)